MAFFMGGIGEAREQTVKKCGRGDSICEFSVSLWILIM